jgi:hypothetical protein
MKNLEKEIEDLMQAAEVHGLRKQVVRREFAQLSSVDKKAFIENFQWEIITNTNKNNYQD